MESSLGAHGGSIAHDGSLRDVGSQVVTRGEPRPVHTTLIATCRVYSSVVVIRRNTPGLSPGYENPTGR
jgi:hypothetical protein